MYHIFIKMPCDLLVLGTNSAGISEVPILHGNQPDHYLLLKVSGFKYLGEYSLFSS